MNRNFIGKGIRGNRNQARRFIHCNGLLVFGLVLVCKFRAYFLRSSCCKVYYYIAAYAADTNFAICNKFKITITE